jgi:hypothetical protein
MGQGKLCRGRIVVIEGELANSTAGTLEFMFNPTEYTISKSNSWTTTANKGRNVPKYEFQGGEPRQLQMELFFNSYLPRFGEQQQDLRLVLNKLFNMMMIDKSSQLKGSNSRMSHPPKCRIEWGGATNHLAFQCYIISCSIKYTMFNEDGIPIRATANLTLKEAMDREDRLPTNPTSIGEPGRRLRTVAEGDRLDWIAYEEYGDAREWRRLAEANHLHNPLDLRAGMVLAIPPR